MYAANLLKVETIVSAGNDLKTLSLVDENQLSDEQLGIGTAMWASLAQLQEEHDLKPFFTAIRKFYIASTTKNFHLVTILKDLGVLQPENTASYSVETIIGLAKHFPQLERADTVMLDQLKEEFVDFILSATDLPPLSQYCAGDNTIVSRAVLFWCEVGKMKTLCGDQIFLTPYVNLCMACCQYHVQMQTQKEVSQCFEKFIQIPGSNLDQSTIISVMSMKFNCDYCCHDIKLDSELLSRCKQATHHTLQRQIKTMHA